MNAIPAVLNEQTVDTVNAANFKNVGELHALTAGLSGQNMLNLQQRTQEMALANMQLSMQSAQQLAQLAGQQALNIQASQAQLQQAITGRVARFMLDLSAEEAVAFTKQIGSDLQDKIANINGVLAGMQEAIKASITTPPQTGTGGAFGSDSGSALLQQIVSTLGIIQSRLDAAKIA